MSLLPYKILLADDDSDDCLFFKEALEELNIISELEVVANGIDLMNYLKNTANNLPKALFLDLNMPLKSGTECLYEIKSDQNLQNLPVVLISTSINLDIVDELSEKGAAAYICKPSDFSKLKNLIQEALLRTSQNLADLQRQNFVIE